MRHRFAHRALVLAVGFGGASAACFSSNNSNPNPDSGAADSPAGPEDSAAPDAGADSTVRSDAGGQPEAAADTGADASGSSEGGATGSIVLPGTVDDSVNFGVNRATSTFYVAWFNSSASPRTYGVSVIDAKTGTVTGNINVRPSRALAVDETNNRIYVSTVIYPDGSAAGTPAIEVVDGTTNQVVSTIYQTQGQTFDAGTNPQNWGIEWLAVDPGANRLYAYLGDGFNNGYVFQFDTDTASGMLLGSIPTPGIEPGWGPGPAKGGGLVVDPTAHRLWAVGGVRPSFPQGATVTTIDTQTFTVVNTGTMQATNASDVAFDPTGDQALAFFPTEPSVDAGGTVALPGSILASNGAGATSTPFSGLPAGLAATYGRVVGPTSLLYANSDAGAYYLLGFRNADAGAWAYHGQSAALTPQPPQPSFSPTSALNPYGFEVVTDATSAYVIALMEWQEYLSGSGQLGFSTSSIQYWKVPLP